MKRQGRLFKLLIFFIAVIQGGCYTFEPVRIQKSVSRSAYEASFDEKYSVHGNSRRVKHTVFIKKYLVNVSSPAPLAKLNNRAVEYILEGKFIEAENLLNDAAAEYPLSPAPYNNLGIICEISGRRKAASDYYLRAAALDEDCARFRQNYLSFDDFGGR